MMAMAMTQTVHICGQNAAIGVSRPTAKLVEVSFVVGDALVKVMMDNTQAGKLFAGLALAFPEVKS